MDNPLKPYEEVGGLLGALFIGIRIFMSFINKKSKKQNNPSDHSNSSSNDLTSCNSVNRDECNVNREHLKQWLDIELRTRLLDQKIEVQRFIKEEIASQSSNINNYNLTDRDIELLAKKYLERKYGEKKD